MKKKIILDIIMTVIMICLMKLSLTGIKIHEILGIVIFVLFIIHKLLNLKWIKSITANITNKNVKIKTKIMYALDVLLLILIILNVGSGILISQFIFTNIHVTNVEIVSQWHHFFAAWLFIIILIHAGLHWDYIRNSLKIKKESLSEKVSLGIISIIILIIIFRCNIYKNILIPKKYTDLENQVDNEVSQTNKRKKENDSTNSNDDSQNNNMNLTEQPTIEEYLSKLFCNGCGRHCPLTSPACGRGMSQQQQKVQEYNQEYNTSETYTSTQNKRH